MPKEVEPMWNAFGTIVESLKTAFSNGLSLSENLEHAVVAKPLTHGVITDVTHYLKRTPRAIIPIGGRVEFCRVLASDANRIQVQVKLFTTIGTSTSLNTLTDRIDVEGIPFFAKDDTISVNGAVAVISRVGEKTITLDKQVLGKSTLSINLETETVTFLLL